MIAVTKADNFVLRRGLVQRRFVRQRLFAQRQRLERRRRRRYFVHGTQRRAHRRRGQRDRHCGSRNFDKISGNAYPLHQNSALGIKESDGPVARVERDRGCRVRAFVVVEADSEEKLCVRCRESVRLASDSKTRLKEALLATLLTLLGLCIIVASLPELLLFLLAPTLLLLVVVVFLVL